MEIFQDTTFLVGISFVIFLVLVYVKGRATILAMLDGRIERIRENIKESSDILADANTMLQQARYDADKASEQAESIKKNAKEEAKVLIKDSEKKFQDMLVRREQQLQLRMQQEKETLMHDIRVHVADIVIKSTSDILAKKSQDDKNNKSVADHLDTISKLH